MYIYHTSGRENGERASSDSVFKGIEGAKRERKGQKKKRKVSKSGMKKGVCPRCGALRVLEASWRRVGASWRCLVAC